MVIRKGSFILATVLAIVAIHGSAFGGGWGPYFSWGRDEPSAGLPDFMIDRMRVAGWSSTLIEAARAVDIDMKLDHLTFGVLYDSAPSQDKLLSYRATLGFDVVPNFSFESVDVPGVGTFDISGFGSAGIDLDKTGYGFTTTHTLGFGIVRTETLKWWVGPGIRLNINHYDLQGSFEAANLSIGGGGETGVNIHVSPDISLCLAGGIHWNAFGYAAGTGDIGSFVWGDGPFYFVQVGVLFHTGEDKEAWQRAITPQPQPEPSVLTPLPGQGQ
jgi:hypothetical protein